MTAKPSLLVHLSQTSPILGDRAANRAVLEKTAARSRADVVVFPELALTGYTLGHRARELGVDLDDALPLALPEEGPTVIYGLVERGEDHLTYNTAAAQRGRSLLSAHRKIYLPTYGTFDEGRVFAPGRRSVRPFDLEEGWRAGLLVCEDFWHPALAYLHALQAMDTLFVLAAAPGRGAPTEEEGARFGSADSWSLLARSTALLHGCYVVLCNRVGVEEGITFAGGSMVVDPSGAIVGRAPQGEAAELEVTLERDAVARARQPYAHLRDEDPAVTLHTLERILRER